MAAMNEKDYYEVLGVSPDADDEQVRKAFQRKARTLHPDVNKEPDAEERFKEVSEAYAVLSDPEKRARYDAMRSGAPAAGPWTQPGGSQGGWGGDPFAGFGDFPFGGARPRGASRAYNPREGSDVEFEVRLTPEQARAGARRATTYQRYGTCEACHGTGSVASHGSATCPTCHGSGHIQVDVRDLLGLGVFNVPCPECEGTGRVVSEPCETCHGSGRTLTADEISFEVPAGSHDGDEVRVPGRGNAGTNGRAAGDFVARVSVPEERVSRRSAMGWQLVGLAAPIVAFELAFGGGAVALWMLLPALLGAWMVLSEGVLHRTGRWWRTSMGQLANGMANGVLVVMLILMMMSCTVRRPFLM